jgi:hypothetical protein
MQPIDISKMPDLLDLVKEVEATKKPPDKVIYGLNRLASITWISLSWYLHSVSIWHTGKDLTKVTMPLPVFIADSPPQSCFLGHSALTP